MEMSPAYLLLAGLLVVCPPVAVQTPLATTDASSVFAYDPTKPLDLTLFEISYDSPKGGRVPGYLVMPSGKGPFAAIVYMHWGQGNKGEVLSEAVDMAQLGVIGLMIDAPYLRPDVPPPAKAKEAESKHWGQRQNSNSSEILPPLRSATLGAVLNVALRWRSSKGSRLLKFNFVLRRGLHETILSNSNSSRARARSASPCLAPNKSPLPSSSIAVSTT